MLLYQNLSVFYILEEGILTMVFKHSSNLNVLVFQFIPLSEFVKAACEDSDNGVCDMTVRQMIAP